MVKTVDGSWWRDCVDACPRCVPTVTNYGHPEDCHDLDTGYQMNYHCAACGNRWGTWWAKGAAEAHAIQAREEGFGYSGHMKSVIKTAKEIRESEGRSMETVVRIHRTRGGIAVSTNAGTEEAFLEAFNKAASADAGGGDTPYDAGIMADDYVECQQQIVDICCKLRGYKANVTEYRVIVAGELVPEDVVDVFGRQKELVPA